MYVLVTVLVALFFALYLKWFKSRRLCLDAKRLDGKTVLITGELYITLCSLLLGHSEDRRNQKHPRKGESGLLCAKPLHRASGTSGVGKETAIALARRGARVCITSHDEQKGEAAVREIKKESPSMNVQFWCLNLANLQSIRNFCREFLKAEKRLDILINLDGYVVDEWKSKFSILFRIVMYVFTSMFFISCQAAAQTVIYCAVSDDILQHNGGYFSDCKPCTLQPHAQDSGIAKKLWEASEAMVGLTSSPREHLATRT
ncbi:retinol dehydrogenase 14-like isoform X3 [Lithobates pipiens]